MKIDKSTFYLTTIALFSMGFGFAAPGPPPPAGPPGPPGLPIDSGLVFLFIIALTYGFYSIKKYKMHKKRLS